MELHRIAELFDARAARYARDDWHRRYAEQLVAITPLRPGDRVLDAGTGTGSRRARSRGASGLRDESWRWTSVPGCWKKHAWP